MLHKIDKVLEQISSFFTPLVKAATPIYKRLVLPIQNQLSVLFFKTLQKYLKVSAKQKKQLLEEQQIKRWRLYTLLAGALQIFEPKLLYGEYFFSLSILTIPFLLLSLKGYRIAYLALLVLQFIGTFNLLLSGLWGALACLVICGGVYAFAFRAENARVELERRFELRSHHPQIQKDVVTSLLLLLVACGIRWMSSLFVSSSPRLSPEELKYEQEKAYRLSLVAGTVVRHVYGYADFCRQEGYELQKYPKAFASRFAPEIARLQQELGKKGSSLQQFYLNAKQSYGRKLFDSIGSEMDSFRRQAIMEMLELQKGIPASQIKWNEAINSSISMQEACLIFDEMYESILSAPSKSFAEVRGYSGE